MHRLWQLFKAFFLIGTFTIGGGYAMLPLFEEEFVNKKKWFTHQDYLDMLTVVTSAPGPIAVNSAVYAGYRLSGILGSAICVIGVILSPVVIILLIVPVYHQFKEITIIQKIFLSARPAVVGLIVASAFRIGKRTQIRGMMWVIPLITFIVVAIFKINVIFLIITLAIIGWISKYITRGE